MQRELGQVVEDYIDYRIFVPESTAVSPLQTILDFIQSIVGDFIFHHDPFVLSVDREATEEAAGFGIWLHGHTKFGDNIEDEWFIVHLLREVSRKFSDVLVSVRDSDGEFLLIEAADAIPTWLSPENSENRVFLRRGLLHIIPMPQTPFELAEIPPRLTATRAARIILRGHIRTEAAAEVQAAIAARLEGMPQSAFERFALC